MRHKHADLIIEWANTGKPLQYWYDIMDKWKDVKDTPLWSEEVVYRFKPEVIEYRRFLSHNNEIIIVYAHENTASFLPLVKRWIDIEWQEVEV